MQDAATVQSRKVSNSGKAPFARILLSVKQLAVVLYGPPFTHPRGSGGNRTDGHRHERDSPERPANTAPHTARRPRARPHLGHPSWDTEERSTHPQTTSNHDDTDGDDGHEKHERHHAHRSVVQPIIETVHFLDGVFGGGLQTLPFTRDTFNPVINHRLKRVLVAVKSPVHSRLHLLQNHRTQVLLDVHAQSLDGVVAQTQRPFYEFQHCRQQKPHRLQRLDYPRH